MINIRTLKPSEFEMINGWQKEEIGYGFEFWMLPPTTFVVEVNETPVAAVSLILTNCHAISQIENLVGNPAKRNERREAIPHLINFVCEYAKSFGSRRIYMNAYVDKLKEKYESFGFTKASDNLSLLWKDIGG